jgi:hypothetical protein
MLHRVLCSRSSIYLGGNKFRSPAHSQLHVIKYCVRNSCASQRPPQCSNNVEPYNSTALLPFILGGWILIQNCKQFQNLKVFKNSRTGSPLGSVVKFYCRFIFSFETETQVRRPRVEIFIGLNRKNAGKRRWASFVSHPTSLPICDELSLGADELPHHLTNLWRLRRRSVWSVLDFLSTFSCSVSTHSQWARNMEHCFWAFKQSGSNSDQWVPAMSD